ncbi:MAG: hypothetical protein NT056_06425 [Proteobacteria bacterium]|nr:hypothetical protein [Pseudomonadota bacterium]
MEGIKFIGKVLADGHLDLPKDKAKEVGKLYEVTIVPLEESGVYSTAEKIASDKGFYVLTEGDIEKIIHESRNIR